MNPTHAPTHRWLNTAGFLACAALLGYAYYAQFHDHLDPCPLCIFERLGVLALGVAFLVAAIHGPGSAGSRVYAVAIAVVALTGAAVAARHVWIQHLPADQVPACGPGLNYLLETFPLTKTLRMVLTGSGDCARISWTFLGLSMPEWVLSWFAGLGAAGFLGNWRTAPGDRKH
ncbi:MAG: disulfide bond formation protein B [Chromatiales bacterium 21-64-14]|nr:MAG: disulfide bond formation protein B [Chromatiales bacterium 21-64-14]HQU16473.1 disulfide bond formation protein B [Gammaproteobacteria bacterium]